MIEQEYKKIEFYLCNYPKINLLIREREMDLIDSINVSNNAWIKSLNETSNTTEDQVIKIIEDNLIKEYKEWQVFLKKILVFLCEKQPLYYNYLKLKYFLNKDETEIIKLLKVDSNKFKILKVKLIEFIYEIKNKENLKSNMEV